MQPMQITQVSPTQQSFGPKRVFPGLDNEQVNRLREVVSRYNITDPFERIKKEQELYKEILPKVKQMTITVDRSNVKNEIYNKSFDEKDPVKKTQLELQYRTAEVADLIKQKVKLPSNTPDRDVLLAYAKDNPDKQDGLLKYINEGDDNVLYDAGLKEYDSKKLMKDLNTPAKNFLGNALADLPQTSMNAASSVLSAADWVLEKLGINNPDEQSVEELTKWMKESGNTSKEIIQKKLGVDDTTNTAKLGAGLTEMIPSVLVGGIIGKTGSLGANIAKGMAEGAAFTAGNNPDASLGDYATNISVGGLFNALGQLPGVAGKLFKKVQQKGKDVLVDDATKTALSTVDGAELSRVVDVATKKAKNINNPSTLDDLVAQMNKAITTKFKEPMKKYGNELGHFRSYIQSKGEAIKVNAKSAIEKLDEIIRDKYGAQRAIEVIKTPKGKNITRVTFEPVFGGTHRFHGEEAKILSKLRDELRKVKSGYDIDTIFTRLNDEYETMMKLADKKPLTQFKNTLSEIREPLEEQLDNVIGGDYRATRLAWKEASEKYEKFSNLFRKSKPGTKEFYGAVGRIKKLFGQDAAAVLDDFNDLAKETGIDFVQKAQVAKFVAEQVGDNSFKFSYNPPSTISKGAQFIYGTKNVLKWVGKKLVGTPLEIAETLVKDYEKLPESEQARILKQVGKALYKLGKQASYTKEDAYNTLKEHISGQ